MCAIRITVTTHPDSLDIKIYDALGVWQGRRAGATYPGGVRRRAATSLCPLRPGEPCALCVPGADGPHNCPTVRLVLDDPELRALWLQKKAESRAGGVAVQAAEAGDAA